MSFAIEGKWEGLADVFKRLEGLSRKVTGKILRPAVKHAAKIVLKAVKAKVPTRTRNLKKSLAVKVKTYRRTGTVVAIIGPRKGRKTQIGTYSRGPNKGKPIYEDPANIAHLVEFGTRPHAIGKGSRLARVLKSGRLTKEIQTGGMHPGAAAQSFIRAGWDATKGPAEQTLRTEILEGLEKFA